MSVRQRALSHLRTAFGDAAPPLRFVFWDGDVFEFARQPTVVIEFSSSRLWRALLRGDFSTLADAYVSGGLKVEGRPKDIIGVGVCLSKRLERVRAFGFLKALANIGGRARALDRDVINVRRHYDVSNEFYKLWLDKRLVYSCAYFHDGTEHIDVAQENKLDHICRKLMLRADEKLLDVGCGWGALLDWSTERYGAVGLGITLSERQFEEAQRRLARLGDKVRLALQHYKELNDDAAFDKIVSVGMYEHVGASAIPDYFRKMATLLKPGGMFLNHGIIATGGSRSGPSGGDFIERYVFPGGSVASLSKIVEEVTRAGLEIVDIEDLRPHYARTLLHWSERLETQKESAIEAAGAATYRIWRVYLAGMAYAFDQGWLSIAQVLAMKPKDGRPAPRPWTRAHQYKF